MITDTVLHTPFELMLFYAVALIVLAVVMQAGKVGRLIARSVLRAKLGNIATSGY